jgi:hypothetical protein
VNRKIYPTHLFLETYYLQGDYKDLKQWRPFSLLCFDYKIIAKFLTNSLAKVINKLIDPSQTGAGPDTSTKSFPIISQKRE